MSLEETERALIWACSILCSVAIAGTAFVATLAHPDVARNYVVTLLGFVLPTAAAMIAVLRQLAAVSARNEARFTATMSQVESTSRHDSEVIYAMLNELKVMRAESKKDGAA